MSDEEKLPAPEETFADRPEVTGNAGPDAEWPTPPRKGGRVGGRAAWDLVTGQGWLLPC